MTGGADGAYTRVVSRRLVDGGGSGGHLHVHEVSDDWQCEW